MGLGVATQAITWTNAHIGMQMIGQNFSDDSSFYSMILFVCDPTVLSSMQPVVTLLHTSGLLALVCFD